MKNYTNFYLLPQPQIHILIFEHLSLIVSIDLSFPKRECIHTLKEVLIFLTLWWRWWRHIVGQECIKKCLGVWGSESSTCWVYHDRCIWGFSLEKVKQQYVCKYRFIDSYACKDLHKCENVQMRLQNAVSQTMWCYDRKEVQTYQGKQ